MEKKRNNNRRRIFKAGSITFSGSGIDCLVRNISDTGAALEVENQIGIPPRFALVIATDHFALPGHLAKRKEDWHRLQFRQQRMNFGSCAAPRSHSGSFMRHGLCSACDRALSGASASE